MPPTQTIRDERGKANSQEIVKSADGPRNGAVSHFTQENQNILLNKLFRMRFIERGGHTHVRVFAGNGTLSLGLCGTLVFRNDEWKEFVAELSRGKAGGSIEVIPEE